MLSSLNVISYFWLPQLLATTILLSVSVELITPGIALVQSHSVIFCGDIIFLMWSDPPPPKAHVLNIWFLAGGRVVGCS